MNRDTKRGALSALEKRLGNDWGIDGDTFKICRTLDVGQDQRIKVHAGLIAPERHRVVELGLSFDGIF